MALNDYPRTRPASQKRLSSLPARTSVRRPQVKEKTNSYRKKAANKFRLPGVPWRKLGLALGFSGSVAAGLLIFFSLGVGFLYAYKYFTSSPYFAVKTIEIEGLSRLKSREVLETIRLSEGMNSLAVSIDEMEQELAANPWVSELSIKRILPDFFQISVKEKEPRFWVRQNGVLFYADIYGRPIAPVAPGNFTSLPTLEVEPGAEEYTRRLPDLVRSLAEAALPVEMAAVSWIRLSASRGVDVRMENNRISLSIGLEEWNANLDRVSRTLADLGKRGELKKVRGIKAHDNNVWVEELPDQS